MRDEIGIEVLEGPLVTTVGGRRSFVAHGDGLGQGDLGYRLLKRTLRSRAGIACFRWLHPDLAGHLIRRVSATESRHTEPSADGSRADRLAAHAETVLGKDPELGLVVFGHTHRPELREVFPGRFYLNPGDWIHHMSYAVVDPERIELRSVANGTEELLATA